jgi:hypothetical protein
MEAAPVQSPPAASAYSPWISQGHVGEHEQPGLRVRRSDPKGRAWTPGRSYSATRPGGVLHQLVVRQPKARHPQNPSASTGGTHLNPRGPRNPERVFKPAPARHNPFKAAMANTRERTAMIWNKAS